MFGQFMAQTSTVDRIEAAADYFRNPSLSPSQVILLLTLFAIVAVAIVVARFIFKYRLARAVYIPAGDIREPGKILQVLDQCIVRRNKLEFKIVGRQNGGQIVSGMPVEIRGGHIILDLSVRFSQAQIKLTGERIHCYFKVRQENKDIFFNFFSSIDRAGPGDGGFLELAVALPDVLIAGQKRNFLRIDPPRDFILELALWPEYIDSATDWKIDIDAFPEPILSNEEDTPHILDLSDISAGGTKLIIDRASLSKSGLSLAKGTRFMLRLNLWDPVEQQELPIWLICRTQQYTSVAGELEATLGVQFIAWSQLKNPDVRKLSWRRLDHDDDEVPPLGNWVAKRYLEHYRKTMVD